LLFGREQFGSCFRTRPTAAVEQNDLRDILALQSAAVRTLFAEWLTFDVTAIEIAVEISECAAVAPTVDPEQSHHLSL
jgi:hypothetical protein